MSATRESLATYLYCVLRHRGAPDLDGAPPGLPGTSAPRAVPAWPSHWLVVGDAPLAFYGEEPLRGQLGDLRRVAACAVAHDAVVAHCFRQGVVAPMRLFTLFRSDARAAAHVLRRRRGVERALDRVAGCAEWGVRVRFDEARGLAARARVPEARPTTGTGFLLAKGAARRAREDLRRSARAEAERLYATLATKGKRSVRRAPAQAEHELEVVLDAAFLVPSRATRLFREAARRATASMPAAALSVTVSGPWPPYSFLR